MPRIGAVLDLQRHRGRVNESEDPFAAFRRSFGERLSANEQWPAPEGAPVNGPEPAAAESAGPTSWVDLVDDIIEDDEWLTEMGADEPADERPADPATVERLLAEFALPDVYGQVVRNISSTFGNPNIADFDPAYRQARVWIDEGDRFLRAQRERAAADHWQPARAAIHEQIDQQLGWFSDLREENDDRHRRYLEEMGRLAPQIAADNRRAAAERHAIQRETNRKILEANAERMADDRERAQDNFEDWLDDFRRY